MADLRPRPRPPARASPCATLRALVGRFVEALAHSTPRSRLDRDIKDIKSIEFLWFFHLDERGAMRLAEALPRGKTLTSMILYYSSVSHEGVATLAKGIAASTIESLFVCWCSRHVRQQRFATSKTVKFVHDGIGDTGAAAFAETIASSKTLTYVSLQQNHIGDVGAVALAEALTRNDTVQELKLKGNDVGDVGAVALAEALIRNETLRELHLDGNPIGERGREALVWSMHNSWTVTLISLSGDVARRPDELRLTDVELECRRVRLAVLTFFAFAHDPRPTKENPRRKFLRADGDRAVEARVVKFLMPNLTKVG